MSSLLNGRRPNCVSFHPVLVKRLKLVEVFGDGRRLPVLAGSRDRVEEVTGGDTAERQVETGLLSFHVSHRIDLLSTGFQRQHTPNFSSTAGAAW